MIETYRFRIYPTEDQKVLLAKHFGTVRFVYNWALNFDTEKYAQCRKHLGWMSICTSDEYHQLKKVNPWMREVNVQSMTSSIAHLDKAFQRFFRHQGGFPKFKSRKDHVQSFEVPENLKIDFKADSTTSRSSSIRRRSCRSSRRRSPPEIRWGSTSD